MRKKIVALVVFLCCGPLMAQSVVVLSEDGKQAWYAPSESSTAVLVGSILRLSGDSPLPDPDPDPDPDQWGLIAVSETAAKSVQGDPNRNESAGKLMAAYVTLGKPGFENVRTSTHVGVIAARWPCP